MKVLGIVAEYNPFHNGHAYHIEQSKAAAGCEAVVCVMSGNFIQRGEPALINKHARTTAALQNGVDLVIELPHPYAISSAESFASGAVKILDSLGIVDCICFGSEYGEISALDYIAGILAHEPEAYRSELKAQLDLGLPFAVCRQNALKKYLEAISIKSPGLNKGYSSIPEILEASNNILGIEYLKALKRLRSSIKAYTVKRVSNSYNTSGLTGEISSATSIRNSILGLNSSEINALSGNAAKENCDGRHLASNVALAIPEHSRRVIEKEFSENRGPISMKSYENIILALLRQITQEQLRNIPDVSEGLEYRIKNAGEISGTIEELIENICTKRYPQTRIQRILFSVLTGLTKSDMELFSQNGGPQYARILGFNQTGRELLSRMKKSSVLPVITKSSDFKNSCNRLLSRMIEIEAMSTDMYVLGYGAPASRCAGQEFTQNIVILK